MKAPRRSGWGTPRWGVTILIAAAVATLAGGCGSPGDAAFDALRESAEVADRTRTYTSWDQLVTQARVGEAGVAAMVVGKVAAVSDGAAFLWEFGPTTGERREQVALDDEDAMTRTVHLTLVVDRLIGDPTIDVQSGDELTIGISFNPDEDFDDLRDSLADLPPSLFLLQRSAVFDYEPGLLGIVEDGALVAVPDDGGDLRFPALSSEDAVQPPDGVTLESLS